MGHTSQAGPKGPKLEFRATRHLLKYDCKFYDDDEDDADSDKSWSYKLLPVKGRCSELIGGFDHLVTPLSSKPFGY